jgi:hypothetical protein
MSGLFICLSCKQSYPISVTCGLVCDECLLGTKKSNPKLERTRSKLESALKLIKTHELGHGKYCGSPNEECDCGSDEDYEKFLKTLEEK